MGFFAFYYLIFSFFDDFFRVLVCLFDMGSRRVDDAYAPPGSFFIDAGANAVRADQDRFAIAHFVERIDGSHSLCG